MTQGKRKDQINFSSRMAFIAFIGLTLCFIWAMTFLPEPQPPTQGPHNYYHPLVWGHDTLTKDTQTSKDDILDIDWDCGDDDSILNYNSFIDIPAGAPDIIMVCGILYERNEDETQWVPIYPDEHVMWIGDNGDTIWE